MESREEEEVVRRWKAAGELEERERERARGESTMGMGMGMGMIEGVGVRRAEEMTVVVPPGKKRRMVGGGLGQRDVVEIDGEDVEEGMSNRSDRTGVTTGRKRKGRS